MNLPPKIIRQQISWKRSITEKVPLSAARPISEIVPETSVPPQGINSRSKHAGAPIVAPHSNEVPGVEDSSHSGGLSSLYVTEPANLENKTAFIPNTQNTDTSANNISDEKPARVVSSEVQKPLGNLPVLSAFQDFLDNERERMRKQILVMSAFYLFVLILIVSISITGGMIMLKSLRKDFQKIQAEVSKLQSLSMKAKTDAETLSERFAKETIKIRTELGSSSEEASEKLSTRVNVYDEKLFKMEKLVQSLMSENAVLKDNLTSLQAHWLGFTNQMMAASAGHIEIARTQSQKTLSNASAPAGMSTMVMSMKPASGDRSMEWRLPIPE